MYFSNEFDFFTSLADERGWAANATCSHVFVVKVAFRKVTSTGLNALVPFFLVVCQVRKTHSPVCVCAFRSRVYKLIIFTQVDTYTQRAWENALFLLVDIFARNCADSSSYSFSITRTCFFFFSTIIILEQLTFIRSREKTKCVVYVIVQGWCSLVMQISHSTNPVLFKNIFNILRWTGNLFFFFIFLFIIWNIFLSLVEWIRRKTKFVCEILIKHIFMQEWCSAYYYLCSVHWNFHLTIYCEKRKKIFLLYTAHEGGKSCCNIITFHFFIF